MVTNKHLQREIKNNSMIGINSENLFSYEAAASV